MTRHIFAATGRNTISATAASRIVPLFCLAACALLAGCGGGGGGGGGDGGGGGANPPPQGSSDWDEIVWDEDDWA